MWLCTIDNNVFVKLRTSYIIGCINTYDIYIYIYIYIPIIKYINGCNAAKKIEYI